MFSLESLWISKKKFALKDFGFVDLFLKTKKTQVFELRFWIPPPRGIGLSVVFWVGGWEGRGVGCGGPFLGLR